MSATPLASPLPTHPPMPISGDEIIAFARANPMTEHPYFRRMKAEPGNLTALWAFFGNLNSVTDRVPHWLARVVAESEDRNVQSFFAAILHDELGQGEAKHNHPDLLCRLVQALDPWKPNTANAYAPGQEIFELMREVFEQEPLEVWHVVGSLLLGEVASRDMVSALAEQVRLQDLLDPSVFDWVHIHDVVEDDHVAGAETMAGLIPRSGEELRSAWAGARWKHDNVWNWLSGLYEITWGESPAAWRA